MDFVTFFTTLTDCLLSMNMSDDSDSICSKVAVCFDKTIVETDIFCPGDEREEKTYTRQEEEAWSEHFDLAITRKRDVLYRNFFGYIPVAEQLPRYVEMARAHAMGRPPPHLSSLGLWRAMGKKEPALNKKRIVISTVIHGRPNVREFSVHTPQNVDVTCSSKDLGASEVFSNELFCCSITCDIDGKTVDAKVDGWKEVYPIDRIKQELLCAVREEMLCETNGRWDARKLPPSTHVWIPDDPTDQKLSLRIAVHLPGNVCFRTIDDLSHAVRAIGRRLVRQKATYLTVQFVTVDGRRYEKSHKVPGAWRALTDDGKMLDLLDHFLTNSSGVVEGDGEQLTFTKFTDHFETKSTRNEKPNTVHDMISWMACSMERIAKTECLLDVGVYHNNGSLRLPCQSKWVDDTPRRKFVPLCVNSTVVDALVHYAHTDTPSIRGEAMVISSRTTVPKGQVDCLTDDLDVQKARDVIRITHGMTVTKVTQKGGQVFLDVEKDGRPSGRGNFCLLKDGWHTTARMYFILNSHGLSARCWSSKCMAR